mgnify:CR=1 FL=1
MDSSEDEGYFSESDFREPMRTAAAPSLLGLRKQLLLLLAGFAVSDGRLLGARPTRSEGRSGPGQLGRRSGGEVLEKNTLRVVYLSHSIESLPARSQLPPPRQLPLPLAEGGGVLRHRAHRAPV